MKKITIKQTFQWSIASLLLSMTSIYAAEMDHAAMTGMDHSNMAGMDHSKMGNADSTPALDCSNPLFAQIDVCKKGGTKKAAATTSMDHSKMQGMDHSKMQGMDHSKMSNDSTPRLDCSNPLFAQIDVCKNGGGNKAAGMVMDHSKMQDMDHSKMQGMDHSKMQGMDHSKMNMPAIPVSDGSIDNVPMPFAGAMHMEDDPILTKIMIDRLEVGAKEKGEFPVGFEASAWIGKDINKVWITAEVKRIEGKIDDAEMRLLYSRAISPYWDLMAGVRKEFKPSGREWVGFGFKGLAPNFFDVDAMVYAGKKGAAAKLSTEYEVMLSQKTAVVSEAGLSLYGQEDKEMGRGAGLSDVSLGVKLRHEITREFAPYVGINWSKKLGDTADFALEEGEHDSDTQIVVGFESWF